VASTQRPSVMRSCWRCTARSRPRSMGEDLDRIVAIDDLYAALPGASYR
jgi:hypothetical protein